MGNPFKKQVIQVGIKVPLTINIDFLILYEMIKEVNIQFATQFDFSLYNGFFNVFTKNEIILTSQTQTDFLDDNEIECLQSLQNKIRSYTLLHSMYYTDTFYFGGAFIFIEKMI